MRAERKGDAMAFRDRTEAGRRLAEQLLHYATCPNLLVLGISPGGLPITEEVVKALRAPLEVFRMPPLRE